MSAAICFKGGAVCYDGPAVVRDIDLEIASGSLHVLLGESGSGKTTLLRTIAGFEPLSAGTLELDGDVVDSGQGRPLAPERRNVGVVFQDYALFPHLDVSGNLAFGQKKRDDARIGELLAAVGLEGYERRAVAELSGGEQQRVALARALAQAPRIILFDEPFSNLNRELRRDLRRRTVSLLRELAITAVFVTHDREEAFSIADTLSVLAGGDLLATGEPLKLYRDPKHIEVARALGDCSVIRGERDGAVLTCALGRLRVRGAGDSVLARPEELGLLAADSTDGAPTKITHIEPQGAYATVTVTVGDEELLLHAEPGAHTVGESVRVVVTASELAAIS